MFNRSHRHYRVFPGQHRLDSWQVLVYHHDVGVDEALDQGGGESVAFYVDAGFVADFAVAEVKFKMPQAIGREGG